jgi:hypothetical protein
VENAHRKGGTAENDLQKSFSVSSFLRPRKTVTNPSNGIPQCGSLLCRLFFFFAFFLQVDSILTPPPHTYVCVCVVFLLLLSAFCFAILVLGCVVPQQMLDRDICADTSVIDLFHSFMGAWTINDDVKERKGTRMSLSFSPCFPLGVSLNLLSWFFLLCVRVLFLLFFFFLSLSLSQVVRRATVADLDDHVLEELDVTSLDPNLSRFSLVE